MIEVSALLEQAARVRETAIYPGNDMYTRITKETDGNTVLYKPNKASDTQNVSESFNLPCCHSNARNKDTSGEESVQTSLPIDADGDLLSEFITESRELLEDSETSLLELENDPEDFEAINKIFRAFHTVKGTSGFLGLEIG